MTTIDFIIQLPCCVSNKITRHDKNPKHNQANFHTSEVVAIALLCMLKGIGKRLLQGVKR